MSCSGKHSFILTHSSSQCSSISHKIWCWNHILAWFCKKTWSVQEWIKPLSFKLSNYKHEAFGKQGTLLSFSCSIFLFSQRSMSTKSSPLLSEHMCPCWVSELPVNDKSQSLSLLACYAFWKCWCILEKGLFVKSQRTQIPLPRQCQVNFPKNWLNSAFWDRFVASLFLSPSKHVNGPTKNQI